MPATNTHLSNIEEASVDKTDTEASHFAVGTDGNAVQQSDTSLGNEVFQDTRDSISKSADSVTVNGIVAASEANGNTLREGATKDASNGDILQGDTFPDTVKTSDIELFLDFTLDFNAKNA